MKGLLHGLGTAPWGHDLAWLSKAVAAAGVEVSTDVSDAMIRLGRFYIATRYPDAHAGGGAAPHYTDTDAADALCDAQEVLAFVDRVWTELSG